MESSTLELPELEIGLGFRGRKGNGGTLCTLA